MCQGSASSDQMPWKCPGRAIAVFPSLHHAGGFLKGNMIWKKSNGAMGLLDRKTDYEQEEKGVRAIKNSGS